MRGVSFLICSCMVFGSFEALAADIPVVGRKLIITDKTISRGKAKVVFQARDLAIEKGPATDPTEISAVLHISYDSVHGAFQMPSGAGWTENSATSARYANRDAPAAGSVKSARILAGSGLQVAAASMGEDALSIAMAPSGPVYVAMSISNGPETRTLCTQFSSCTYRALAGPAYKLSCVGESTGDSNCTAIPPTTTTTTIPTTTTTLASGCLTDLGTTVRDTCEGLEWEKKTTAVGSGANAGDLHDVDNQYQWSGTCSLAPGKLCQPDAAAEAACKANVSMVWWADGCEQCTAGEGVCRMTFAESVTTIWDWLVQLNAASFAGHSDWRIPSQAACYTCWDGVATCNSCPVHELETLLSSPYPCTAPCHDPAFGPTQSDFYFSESTVVPQTGNAYRMRTDGLVSATGGKAAVSNYIRAVRDLP